jgi:hypothetical protein
VLKLGITAGVRQDPTAIALMLTDAEGKEHQAELAEPEGRSVAGLKPASSHCQAVRRSRCQIHISKSTLWHASGQLEDFKPEPKKRYTLPAQFTGKGVILVE